MTNRISNKYSNASEKIELNKKFNDFIKLKLLAPAYI